MKKIFIVRKYIAANDALDAIQKERHTAVHEVFLDDSWLREQAPNLNRMMRMHVPSKDRDVDLDEIT